MQLELITRQTWHVRLPKQGFGIFKKQERLKKEAFQMRKEI